MMEKTKKNVPEFRFPGFDQDWVKHKLGDEINESGYGPRFTGEDYSLNGNVKTIRGTDISLDGEILYDQVPLALLEDSFIKNHILEDGDLVIITTADCGLTGVFREQKIAYIPSAYAVKLRFKKTSNPFFFKYYFQTQEAKNQVNKFVRKATVANLPGSDILRFFISFPLNTEQTKIVSFLTAVDYKLQNLKKKKTLLEQYKKGVTQKIFTQELRFKDEDREEYPDWEEKTLGEVALKKTVKNKDNAVNSVLTNSASSGIVYQRDFFDKDIANQNNLLNYYIVEKDDFVYNPRISNLAPVGPIGRNHLEKGVMSPLYSVFKFTQGNLEFFEIFFSTTGWHEYMESIANYGARADRMNITSAGFYLMPIPFPSLTEQTKISNFLSAIYEKITLCTAQIEKAEKYKKGLLQKMFC